MNRLTFKQKLFAKKYVENGGNGLQTALQVYNTTDPNVAKVIASENLTNPNIKESIDDIARQQGITSDTILRNFAGIATRDVEKVSANAVIKANVELAKILRLYPSSKHTNLNVSLKGDLGKMKYNEAKQALTKLRGDNDALLGDSEADV